MAVSDYAEILTELGREARQRREEKNLSLEEIYERTRVRLEFLRGIEQGNYEGFPDLVYIKGFVRTYLGVIGAEDLKEDFQNALGQKSQQPNGPIPPTNVLGNGTSPTKGFKPASRFWLFSVLLLVLIGAGGYVWYSWSNLVWPPITFPGGGTGNGVTPASADSEDITYFDGEGAHSEDVSTTLGLLPLVSEEAAVPVPPPPTPSKSRLTLRSRGDVWVRVVINDKTLLAQTLKSNVVASWDLTAPARVTYGRPNMVSADLNGKDLGIVNSKGSKKSETYIYNPDGTYRKVQ